MVPQTTQPRKRRNSSRVNLLISLVFHTTVVLGLFYFAAHEGLLGKQLKKIAVEMVREKPPEKPKQKELEKPQEEPPDLQPTKQAEAPKFEAPKDASPALQPSLVAAPPALAPPAAEIPSFVFEGGKAVVSSSDPIQIYKGLLEYAFRLKWNRPADIADQVLVAEVEVSVDQAGQITNPEWKKGSGNKRWDESVHQAIAATKTINRRPPSNFPTRVLVRFDVQEVTEALTD